MPPVAHPGRLLRRELAARSLSANRLALDLGVPSGRHHRHSQWTAVDHRRYRAQARPLFRQRPADSGSTCRANTTSPWSNANVALRSRGACAPPTRPDRSPSCSDAASQAYPAQSRVNAATAGHAKKHDRRVNQVAGRTFGFGARAPGACKTGVWPGLNQGCSGLKNGHPPAGVLAFGVPDKACDQAFLNPVLAIHGKPRPSAIASARHHFHRCEGKACALWPVREARATSDRPSSIGISRWCRASSSAPETGARRRSR